MNSQKLNIVQGTNHLTYGSLIKSIIELFTELLSSGRQGYGIVYKANTPWGI